MLKFTEHAVKIKIKNFILVLIPNAASKKVFFKKGFPIVV